MIYFLKILGFIFIFCSGLAWANQGEVLIKVIQSSFIGKQLAVCNYLLISPENTTQINPFQLEPAKVWDEGMNFYYDLYSNNKRFSSETIESLKKHGGNINPHEVVMQINYYLPSADKSGFEIKATIVAFRGQKMIVALDNFNPSQNKFDTHIKKEEMQTPLMKDFPQVYQQGIKQLEHDAVYEIGKMGSVDLLNGATLPPSMLIKAIQMDALNNFKASEEKTLIVAHAMSSAHARLYNQKYGLKIWDQPVYLRGDSKPHYLVYNYLDKVMEALKVN